MLPCFSKALIAINRSLNERYLSNLGRTKVSENSAKVTSEYTGIPICRALSYALRETECGNKLALIRLFASNTKILVI